MADFDSGNDETGEERTAYLTYVRRCMYVILPVGTVMSFMVPVFFLITSAVTLVGTFIFSFWKISRKNKWKTICVFRHYDQSYYTAILGKRQYNLRPQKLF